uniref:Transmembrane protein 109 n=1 Tax=Serinus canaria TaxID=9135 RepID=A0A8C9N4A6_SERCA
MLGGPQNQKVDPKTSRVCPSQHPHIFLSPQIPGFRMGSALGHWALLALLLWIPFLMGSVGDGAKDGQEGFRGRATTSDDLLLRLGRSTWDTLENWVGHQPLQMVAEVGSQFPNPPWSFFSPDHTLWDPGGSLDPVPRSPAGPMAALVGSWVLARLRGLLLPLLRGMKLFFFLGAFLHVAASQESPTVQAGMLLGLWLLYAFLSSLVASPDPSARLDAAVKSLEWKVEELRRRQKFGGPRNRED